jgi:hypothetical protein
VPADLARVKLRAVASALPIDGATLVDDEFALGAALRGNQTGAVWVADNHERSLGPVLLWANRHHLNEIHLITDNAAGLLARRAAALTTPVHVWEFANAALTRTTPSEPLPKIPVPESHEQFATTIQQSGADVVREHGILTGEVLGLEICRVVDTPEGPKLEIGVGAHDRETFQLVNSHRTIEESLTQVVTIVAKHRAPGAEPHPLNRLAPDRRLRHHLLNNPHLVNATTLQPAEPPVIRRNLLDASACIAQGTTTTNEPLIVAITATVDVDIVTFAIDAQLREHPQAHITIATYAGNLTPSLRNVAEAASNPALFVELPRIL